MLLSSTMPTLDNFRSIMIQTRRLNLPNAHTAVDHSKAKDREMPKMTMANQMSIQTGRMWIRSTLACWLPVKEHHRLDHLDRRLRAIVSFNLRCALVDLGM